MKGYSWRQLFPAIALFGCVVAGTALSEGQKTALELFAKSREQSDLRAKGSPGFVLSGTVRIWLKKNKLADGKYQFVWTPEGKWREEITLADYKRTRIGNEMQFWQVRTTEDENPAVFELDRLLNGGRAPKMEAEDKFREAEPRKVGEIEMQCMRRETKSQRLVSYCFDAKTRDLIEVSSGSDSEIPWKIVWREYANFQEWSGKRWPRLMSGYNGKELVAEARFDDLKPLSQLASDFFTPLNEATSWAYCSGGDVWKLKEGMPPAYPLSARIQRREGTVVLSGVIGENGHVTHLKVARRAALELNGSATTAVSQWRYERAADCLASKGATETFIDVDYYLLK